MVDGMSDIWWNDPNAFSEDSTFEECDDYADAMMPDGFEEAIIGMGHQFNNDIAIYDYSVCVRILMERDNMSREEAIEFMEYNVMGAWVGPNTPVFLRERVYQESK